MVLILEQLVVLSGGQLMQSLILLMKIAASKPESGLLSTFVSFIRVTV